MESDSQILSTPSQDRDYATSAHFNKAHTHYKRDHHHDEHIEYDPNMKVEFVPPVEGTPAALALAANAAIKLTKLEKGFHKFRTLRRPKMKSLNIVKKINKTTKTKRSKKHFSTNFKGKVIDGVHELYTLTAGMMLGIRYSIDQVMRTDAPNSVVQSVDFSFEESVPFPPKGNTTGPHTTPAHSLAHTFEFKTYSPKVFKRLREFFDIDAPSFMHSVCGDYNYLEFISNSKSGQFFFYSHDGKYMLKTQTKEENKFMRRILPNYYKYMSENPHSLLVRILGMFRIEMYHLRRKVHFVIMSSVFDSPVKINTIYDLKGSLIGREATAKDRETGGVLKDKDLLNDNRKIHLGSKKPAFIWQLKKDCEFLARNHIMDYSLLVGIHDRSTRQEDLPAETGSVDAQVKATPTSRPHSNTPFRRSLHVEGAAALAIAEKAAAALANHQPFQGKHDMEERSVNSDGQVRGHLPSAADMTPSKTLDEQKDLTIEPSPGASLDERSVMSGTEARDFRLHLPSLSVDYSANGNLGKPLSDDEYEEEGESSDDEEEDEDLDEGDSDDGAATRSKALRSLSEEQPPSEQLAKFSLQNDTEGHAYGKGIAYSKPWTSRTDGGINSRVDRARGNEIYFIGVIDILQEYNTAKRAETMIKGLTNDVRQISSVDPVRYAQRFVKFMEDNTD